MKRNLLTTKRSDKAHQRKPQIKVRSVPRQLATLTSLPAQNVQIIAQTLNPLIADALVLYMKSKNFHWHVYGKHFRDYHLLFDEHANEILSSVDTLAERIRKLGAVTLKSIGQVSRLQTLKDDDDDVVSPNDMIQRLLDDNLNMAKDQREAINLCEDLGDTPTANVLQEILDQTERRIWFLFELTQD